MMLPLERFRGFITENNLFKVSDKILLAVSGGRDSVLMATFFNALDIDFGIAHCNFGLRGTASDADETFTRQLAEKFEVPFYSKHFDTEKYAASRSVSIQMAARELRYQWFEEIRIGFKYDYIALAHHKSDSVETILLNLVRGTGISGLHGILPKRQHFIRPLLFLSRQEIDQIVQEENIPYREDASNASTKYARNKIRLEVIPKLKEINPALEITFEKNSERFAELEEFLQRQTGEIRQSLFKKTERGIEIRLNELKQLKPLNLLLFELFKPFGFQEEVLHDLVQSWNGQSGKTFCSPTHEIILDRDFLLLIPRKKHEKEEVFINSDDDQVKWKNYKISFFNVTIEDFKLIKDSNKAYFDSGLIRFPLKIRGWNAGDYFFPFGMKGKKKLSDYFTSLKIPLSEKLNIPILENGNGDILWIAGHRSDERYKITGATKNVTIFELAK